ncbi:Adenylate kinase isoenzyme 5 [Camelus dromedarius]|uniref:Adenylate kinase isoenzyme 5 n=1 Tax=Camelus dromedarius TaxID=9838 RepID=A0A5N4DDM1_CAMDR|nr:Adenylate kinase isoenzyme 5 [Camelus dromedarius]
MNTNDAKEYLARREIPQLFESLLNGLMCSKPEDPVEYLESCLQKVKELGGCDKVKWDTFVSQEKKTLPPLNGGQSRRSFLRNVMPENSNFPYRRYDRLPPIHQYSIESDTDLSETAELIEEYEVFDPTRPRPKIILVIGGPGSGKGTQSLKIAERYGFHYISVGELLRKKIHSTSSNRKWSLIAKIITTGELAPQETTITEIKQKLMQIPDEVGIVIDGFPRDVAQALSFEDQHDYGVRLKLIFMSGMWSHLTNVDKPAVAKIFHLVYCTQMINGSLACCVEKAVEAESRALWSLAVMTLCPFQIESLRMGHICGV